MSGQVVVDASLAAMWAISEPHSEKALALAEQWAQKNTQLLAPCLILSEINNAFYKRVVRKEISLATAQEAMEVVLAFGFAIHEEVWLQSRAMELAGELKLPATYDCQYLALAELLGCELWTGDKRLHEAAKLRFNWVRWIGDYAL